MSQYDPTLSVLGIPDHNIKVAFVRHEYRGSDKGVSLFIKEEETPFEEVFTTQTAQKITDILILMPYWVSHSVRITQKI